MSGDKSDDFVVFGLPAIEQDEIDEVVATLKSGWLGTGPRVQRFEREFAAYKGVAPEQVIALSSCTAALHLSLVAAGIGPGDEVITTPLTFCATANSILHTGATPVIADVDPVTMNLVPELVEEKIGPRTKAVLPVHFAGRSCDMEALAGLAKRHGLLVIEDCAHAIETTTAGGERAGTIGDYGCFSFYVTKNIVTGEGGMLIARDVEQAARARRLSLHGMSKDAWKRFGSSGYAHYEVVEAGFKYNMMDLQAAIGIHQLARIEKYWQRRSELWQLYSKELAGLPLDLPVAPTGGERHAFHLYTPRVKEDAGVTRDDVLRRLTEAGIGAGVHYVALPDHPLYQERLGWRPTDVPVATSIGRRTFSVPLSVTVSDDVALRVVAALRSALT